jgi:hypothetical protein
MNYRSMLLLGCLLTFGQSVEATELLLQAECRGSYQGNPMGGTLTVERWSYHGTHRIFGAFRDGSGNLLNFEVDTNQPGGWGEVWVNHARHRGERVLIELVNDGFVAHPESGGSARFVCG